MSKGAAPGAAARPVSGRYGPQAGGCGSATYPEPPGGVLVGERDSRPAGLTILAADHLEAAAGDRREGFGAGVRRIHQRGPCREVEPMWSDRLRASTVVAPGAAAVELGLQVARAVVS